MTPSPTMARALFLSVFAIATCGLVYELVAGALASYVLGDSVTWFSFVIGTYLSAMGLGSWLSRHVEGDLVARFVEVEVAVALVGGFEAPLLFTGFALTPAFRPLLFTVVALVGIGVGLELPLLIRILESRTTLKELLARVLFLDYIGALVASLAFPLLLVPTLGLLRSSLALGLVNAGVAWWTVGLFDAPRAVRTRLRLLSGGAIAALCAGLLGASELESRLETALYADPVVYAEQTPYQRIVLTRAEHDTRLYLDGNLQFSSMDEYRYHEALVHPAMALAPRARAVLVLGGGDGMAVREALRWPEVESVTLVDLDPAMTRIFSEQAPLAELNGRALSDPRVQVVNADAMRWIEEARPEVDVAILDFPDPNNYALGKLYSTWFYRSLAARLPERTVIAVQATSAFYSAQAYWCVVNTLAAAGWTVRPYHAWVPSFGDWGYVLATRGPTGDFRPFPDGLRFLDAESLPTLFHFPRDMKRPEAPVNRLDNAMLVRLYEEDWRGLR